MDPNSQARGNKIGAFVKNRMELHLSLERKTLLVILAVVTVLQEPQVQARLRASGRRWVEERYDWRRVYPAWDEVYARLVSEQNHVL